jgi:AAA15 family ATPase/GTPase
MLKSFEVKGFKNFHNPIKLNLADVRDYQFSQNCVTDGLISKLIIYGKNAIGKTNFGRALLDVWDYGFLRRLMNSFNGVFFEPVPAFLNTRNSSGFAEFRYIFQFGNQQVEYLYKKNARQVLNYEAVSIDDELIFAYDRENPNNCNTEGITKLSPTLLLDFDKIDSVFNYVVSNTPLEIDHPLRQTMSFINNMMFLRSYEERLNSIARGSLPSIFDDKDVLQEFEEFLHESGIHEKLTIRKDNDEHNYLYFKTTPPLSFNREASSGTKALLDFFVVYKTAKNNKTSLLFLDEFDSFYHFELAESIIKMLWKLKNTQVFITSHNTNLLSNRIMRPDCYFILTKNNLTSFANATDRELREGHNLEKLFMSGEFDE